MLKSNVDIYELAGVLDVAALTDDRLAEVFLDSTNYGHSLRFTVRDDISVDDAVGVTAEIIGDASPDAVSSNGRFVTLHFDYTIELDDHA